MKAGKIVKITVSVIVLGGLAAAGNYFIGRDGSYYQTAKDGSQTYAYINEKNSFGHIVKHPAFSDFSDFIIPWKDRWNSLVMPYQTLRSVCDMNHYNTKAIINGFNFMLDVCENQQQVFYRYYSEAEMKEDQTLEACGLFFIPGEKNAPFAFVVPGGGFTAVCSFGKGFPVAQKLHEEGYNVFILQYRVATGQTTTNELIKSQEAIANQDFGKAMGYILDHADKFQVSSENYSVWGFSAGGRLSQLWGLDNEYGYQRYGLPSPAAAMLAYSGWYDEDFAGCYGTQPPTFFAYVKEDKVIGEQNVKDIEKTIDIMKNLDKDIEVRAYDHAYHGFGTGAGTDADGWMDEAISFWEKEM